MTTIEQHFCDICSRGVILQREPVYRCRSCGKVVCRDCFNPPLRLCEECYALSIDEARRSRLLADEAESSRRTEEDLADALEARRAGLVKARFEALRWMIVAPVLFTLACWFVFHVLLSLPRVFWLTVAAVHDVIFVLTGLARYPWKEDLLPPRLQDKSS